MGEPPGSAADYQDGELLFAGRSPLPFLNGALRSRREASATELLGRAREFFARGARVRDVLLARRTLRSSRPGSRRGCFR